MDSKETNMGWNEGQVFEDLCGLNSGNINNQTLLDDNMLGVIENKCV